MLGAEAVTLGMIWISTFFIVYVFVAHRLGFGLRGVVAGIFLSSTSSRYSILIYVSTGSVAAGWQSYAYGAFTPLGGVFAFLTSMAMLGRMQSVAAITGVIVATIVTVCVCAFAGGAWGTVSG